jgi:hypothetical protein
LIGASSAATATPVTAKQAKANAVKCLVITNSSSKEPGLRAPAAETFALIFANPSSGAA